ncbi:hypothetical protein EDB86DRAFT_2917254 [Lactarius hatsudake]|nr:hypothetical protein EDB86DRAFT_2917254 [Lactarius hatsudake]
MILSSTQSDSTSSGSEARLLSSNDFAISGEKRGKRPDMESAPTLAEKKPNVDGLARGNAIPPPSPVLCPHQNFLVSLFRLPSQKTGRCERAPVRRCNRRGTPDTPWKEQGRATVPCGHTHRRSAYLAQARLNHGWQGGRTIRVTHRVPRIHRPASTNVPHMGRCRLVQCVLRPRGQEQCTPDKRMSEATAPSILTNPSRKMTRTTTDADEQDKITTSPEMTTRGRVVDEEFDILAKDHAKLTDHQSDWQSLLDTRTISMPAIRTTTHDSDKKDHSPGDTDSLIIEECPNTLGNWSANTSALHQPDQQLHPNNTHMTMVDLPAIYIAANDERGETNGHHATAIQCAPDMQHQVWVALTRGQRRTRQPIGRDNDMTTRDSEASRTTSPRRADSFSNVWSCTPESDYLRRTSKYTSPTYFRLPAPTILGHECDPLVIMEADSFSRGVISLFPASSTRPLDKITVGRTTKRNQHSDTRTHSREMTPNVSLTCLATYVTDGSNNDETCTVLTGNDRTRSHWTKQNGSQQNDTINCLDPTLEYYTLVPSKAAKRQSRSYRNSNPLRTNSAYIPHLQELFLVLINTKEVVNRRGIALIEHTMSNHTNLDEVEEDRPKPTIANGVEHGAAPDDHLLRHLPPSLSTKATYNDPDHGHGPVASTAGSPANQPNNARQYMSPCHALEQPHDPNELATQRHRRRGSSSQLTIFPLTPANLAIRYLVGTVTETVDYALNHSSEGRNTPSRRSKRSTFEAATRDIIACTGIGMSSVLAALIYRRRIRLRLWITLEEGGDERMPQGATIEANKYLDNDPLGGIYWAMYIQPHSLRNIRTIEQEFHAITKHGMKSTNNNLLEQRRAIHYMSNGRRPHWLQRTMQYRPRSIVTNNMVPIVANILANDNAIPMYATASPASMAPTTATPPTITDTTATRVDRRMTTNCRDAVTDIGTSDPTYVPVATNENGFAKGSRNLKVGNRKCLAINSMSVASRNVPPMTTPLAPAIPSNQVHPPSNPVLAAMSQQSTPLPPPCHPEPGRHSPCRAQPARPSGPSLDTGRRSTTEGYNSVEYGTPARLDPVHEPHTTMPAGLDSADFRRRGLNQQYDKPYHRHQQCTIDTQPRSFPTTRHTVNPIRKGNKTPRQIATCTIACSPTVSVSVERAAMSRPPPHDKRRSRGNFI